MVKFATFNAPETNIINEIVDRAGVGLEQITGQVIDKFGLRMDIAATHARCPLDLSALAAAPDFDFYHDVCGIMRHLNRSTGKLSDGFLPRYAL